MPSRAVYVLFNNCTAKDIHVPKASRLGRLINQAFYDFELTVPAIGPIPAQLTSDEYNDTVTFTKPHEIIAITSILPVSRESVCRSELTDDTHLMVYAVSTAADSEADALHNEVDRQLLREVLKKYKVSKDSLDCGLTNIHRVCIPTNPNAEAFSLLV